MTPVPWDQLEPANAVVAAVAHDFYREHAKAIVAEKLRTGGVLVDVKGMFPRDDLAAKGVRAWRL